MRRWFKWGGIAYFIIFANALYPTVLFEDARVNRAVFATAQIIPVMVWTCIVLRWNGWRLVCGGIGLLPVVLLALCLAIGSLAGNLFEPGFERTHHIELGWTQVAAYQTNGGAMTSFGMIVRQERRLFTGVMLIRELANVYPAYSVAIERPSNRIIRLTFPPYDGRRPQTVIVEKRLWVL
jgi:hypothetical protein